MSYFILGKICVFIMLAFIEIFIKISSGITVSQNLEITRSQSLFVRHRRTYVDRAERHNIKSRFLLLILLIFSPLFLEGKKKGGKIIKVAILSNYNFFLISRSQMSILGM